MMLPTVDFCGLKVTRLIIGANPFGGFSHQSEQRDQGKCGRTIPSSGSRRHGCGRKPPGSTP